MPYTQKQRRFAYAELARAQEGKRTQSGMTLGQLIDYAHAPLEKRKPQKGGK